MEDQLGHQCKNSTDDEKKELKKVLSELGVL